MLTTQYMTNQEMGPFKKLSPISRTRLSTSDLPRGAVESVEGERVCHASCPEDSSFQV
jgi:hypothetical protein